MIRQTAVEGAPSGSRRSDGVRATTAGVAFAAALVLLSGCVLAAAGAGAGGAIYLTTRGAESLVNAGVEDVAGAVDETFQELDIQRTGASTEDGGDERQVRGSKGDLEVTVDFRRESPTTTKVEVTAREDVAEWDKDYAKRVLAQIVKRS
jgi:Protein of unknown function (DUF3568)